MLEHLVIDAGAIIKGDVLSFEGVSKRFYTTADVLKEIRDKKARSFLERLPFTLEVKEPSDEALKVIMDFSKKTGDFNFMSLADMKILALTYMLEVQESSDNGTSFLRSEPCQTQVSNGGRRSTTTSYQTVERVYRRKKPTCQFFLQDSCRYGEKCRYSHEITATIPEEVQQQNDGLQEEQKNITEKDNDTKVISEQLEQTCFESNNFSENEDDNTSEEDVEDDVEESNTTTSRILSSQSTYEAPSSSSYKDDDKDGGDWITIDNMSSYVDSPFGSFVQEEDGAKKKQQQQRTVGCITMDYAMQNVMLQMGLYLLSSTNGCNAITRVKQWILQCVACFYKVTALDKKFCPRCGNATLERISCSIDATSGVVTLYKKAGRPVSTGVRGSKYSLPTPRGGKSGDLLLREDQMMFGIWKQRNKKRGDKVSAFGDNGYLTASVGVQATRQSNIEIGFGRRNRNEQKGRERRGKKKNRK